MGGGDSTPAVPDLRGERKEYRVLVTGFGHFDDAPDDDSNTSHLLTNLLPSVLAPNSPFNPTSLPITILNPTAGDGNALDVSYRYVRTHLPRLWSTYGNTVDLILHLGMADGWSNYTLERGAWKEGTSRKGPRVVPGNVWQECWTWGREYEWPTVKYYSGPNIDINGETVEDLEDDLHPWMGREWPDKLLTLGGVDLDGVVDRVNEILDREVNGNEKQADGEKKSVMDRDPKSTNLTMSRFAKYPNDTPPAVDKTPASPTSPLPQPPCKTILLPHSEGGPHLCGFTTYESLANKRRGNYTAMAGFCHIPGWKDEESLGKGRDVVLTVIGVLMGGIERGEIVG